MKNKKKDDSFIIDYEAEKRALRIVFSIIILVVVAVFAAVGYWLYGLIWGV